jgi:methyl-accepting chemotaxis protein
MRPSTRQNAALVLQVMDRLDVRRAERTGRLQNAFCIDIAISVFFVAFAGNLMGSMGEMQIRLRRMVGTVVESSGQVQTAGEEIAAASRDLAARTEANADSLEETAAASNSLSDRAKRLADEISFSKPR